MGQNNQTEKDQYSRTKMLLGEEALELLHRKSVLVFGVGGVGGYAAEALARSGVGHLSLVDNDRVALSNLNRQIYALHSTIGQYKVDVAAARIHDIDPDIDVRVYRTFYLPETAQEFDFSSYDYIVDAIDTVTAKLDIIERADRLRIPVISAMGCGNRTDPTKLTVTDIYKTSMDPLARVMRRELKKRGVKALKVVCSTEPALHPLQEGGAPGASPDSRGGAADPAPGSARRSIPGSTAFVPAAAGMILASEVVRTLISPES